MWSPSVIPGVTTRRFSFQLTNGSGGCCDDGEEPAEEDNDETGPDSKEIRYGIRTINGKALGHARTNPC
jgi:hypothetical protein